MLAAAATAAPKAAMLLTVKRFPAVNDYAVVIIVAVMVNVLLLLLLPLATRASLLWAASFLSNVTCVPNYVERSILDLRCFSATNYYSNYTLKLL